MADEVGEKLEKATPWLGVYIASASMVCTIAMAADAFNGFRGKWFWFPSKYFSLNATTLTLLAVAMKQPLDFNTNMFSSETDSLAKHTSLFFMLTAMTNFISCLGSMGDQEFLANMVALGILVITIAANVLVQLFMVLRYSEITILIPTILMLWLMVKSISIAIMVPTMKRRMEAKYQKLHKLVLKEEDASNLRRGMIKYWVMAVTSNPQFMMARSVVCTTSVCFISAPVLLAIYIFAFRSLIHYKIDSETSYKESTILILVIQSIGVIVGAIVPTLRWLSAVTFKFTTAVTNWKGFKTAFKIESIWTQILVNRRDSFSSTSIRKGEYRKCFHDVKWFALNFCIGLQIFALYLTKLFIVFPFLFGCPLFSCLIPFKIIKEQDSTNVEESIDHLNRYVLLLDGEARLPSKVLKKMRDEANNIIETGRQKQPRYLVSLLRKFDSFNGVEEFDSSRIPFLHSEEPPNCWMLPVVTLASIAIALPNTATNEHKQLLSSVSEGFSLVKLVEKTLNENAELVNVRKAAGICWVGVVLYTKWLETDLRRASLDGKNSKQVLLELSENAKGIITKFMNAGEDPTTIENPLNWPAKIIAANSMYRIVQTILLSCEVDSELTGEVLFEKLSVMIADILAACLTNLPRAMTTMCHYKSIEKREKSIRKAFMLLGKTEEVVEVVQKKERPHMDHDKAAQIDEWRALLRQNHDNPAAATSVLK